jgi:hypothetical protein
MSKKGIISLILLIALAVMGYFIITKYKSLEGAKGPRLQNQSVTEPIQKAPPAKSVAVPANKGAATPQSSMVSDAEDIGSVSSLHSDVLRVIAAGKETISGISPLAAQKEIDSRFGNPAFKELPVILTDFPVGILKLIANSPASIAGINPKTAMAEIDKRTTIKNPAETLGALQEEEQYEKKESEQVAKWDKNEQAEEVVKGIKDVVNGTPDSVTTTATKNGEVEEGLEARAEGDEVPPPAQAVGLPPAPDPNDKGQKAVDYLLSPQNNGENAGTEASKPPPPSIAENQEPNKVADEQESGSAALP